VNVAHEARIRERHLCCAEHECRREALVAVSARHLAVALQDLGRLLTRRKGQISFVHLVRVGVQREVHGHVLVVEGDGRTACAQRCDPRQLA
jgi:hypothetical protein